MRTVHGKLYVTTETVELDRKELNRILFPSSKITKVGNTPSSLRTNEWKQTKTGNIT
jgi:hypothetical protein